MSKSYLAVGARFAKLLKKVEPSALEVGRARTALKGIRTRLSADGPIVKTSWIGSHSKGTAIRLYSDVDLLVVFPRKALEWGSSYINSATLLSRVKRSLEARYPSSDIRRDGQAVVVRFEAGRHAVDVVPGVYNAAGPRGHPEYAIPDGQGGWIVTSPDLELSVFKAENKKAGAKLAGLVRLFKAWCRTRSTPIPLKAIHIERLLWTLGTANGPATYSTLFARGLYALDRRGGAALRDPLQVSGLIPVAPSPAQVDSVLRSVGYSLDHALAALDAEERGKTDEAVRQWRIVFKDEFPSRLG